MAAGAPVGWPSAGSRQDAATALVTPKDYVPRLRSNASKIGMGGLGMTSGSLSSFSDLASSLQQAGASHPTSNNERERQQGSRQPPRAPAGPPWPPMLEEDVSPSSSYGNVDGLAGGGGDCGIPVLITQNELNFGRAPPGDWGSSMLASSLPATRNTSLNWNGGPSAYEVDGRPGTRDGRPGTRTGTSSGARPVSRMQGLSGMSHAAGAGTLEHAPGRPSGHAQAANGARRMPAPLAIAHVHGSSASKGMHSSTAHSGKSSSSKFQGPHGGKLAPLPIGGAATPCSGAGRGGSRPSRPAAPPRVAVTDADMDSFLNGLSDEEGDGAAKDNRTGGVDQNGSDSHHTAQGSAAASWASHPGPAQDGHVVGNHGRASKVSPTDQRHAKSGSLSATPLPALMATRAAPAGAKVGPAQPRLSAASVLAVTVPRGGRVAATSTGDGAADGILDDAAIASAEAAVDVPEAMSATPSRAQRAAMRAVDHIIELVVREGEVNRLVQEADRHAVDEERVELTDEAWESMVRSQQPDLSSSTGAPGADFAGLLQEVQSKLPVGKKSIEKPALAPFCPNDADFKHLASIKAMGHIGASSKLSSSPIRSSGSVGGATVAVAGGMGRYNRLR